MDVSRYVKDKDKNIELKFTVEFVTPCFLGGADGNAEIRIAPFKSGIRYWWRVLYGNKYGKNIKKIEAEIFGSTDGKSKVILSLIDTNISEKNISKGVKSFEGKKITVIHNNQISILDFLAYGKQNRNNNNIFYSFINVESNPYLKFNLKISSHDDEIINALKAFITFGGVGAKSRNGFGSMKSKEIDEMPWIGGINLQSNPTSFSTISDKAKYLETKKKDYSDWKSALADVGIAFKEAKGNLEDYHEYFRRSLVSRPIIPQKREDKDIIKNDPRLRGVMSDRFPKNFFMGVSTTEDGKYYGYILVLPVLFYNERNIDAYNKVIDDMVKSIKNHSFEDKTQEFKNKIGGAK